MSQPIEAQLNAIGRARRYALRLCIWETDYGRSAGWIVERNGEPLALLDDVEYSDMFWDSYALTVLAPDSMVRQRVESASFWDNIGWDGVVWRNRAFGLTMASPIPKLLTNLCPPRVAVRGLYVKIEPPRSWDRLVLLIRRMARVRPTLARCSPQSSGHR